MENLNADALIILDLRKRISELEEKNAALERWKERAMEHLGSQNLCDMCGIPFSIEDEDVCDKCTSCICSECWKSHVNLANINGARSDLCGACAPNTCQVCGKVGQNTIFCTRKGCGAFCSEECLRGINF